MSAALAVPVLTAAGVLCLSALAKLRTPEPAARSLAILGLPLPSWIVRGAAAAELATGVGALAAGGRVAAALLAGAYATFAALSARLARQRAACGCFGEASTPASSAQALLSLLLAGLCLAAVLWPVPGLEWVFGRGPAQAATLAVGLAGCVYAAVLTYTELPAAWTAWSGR